MSLLLRLAALSLLVAAAMVTAAHAERRIALVIGNSAYSGVSPLANPKNDADLMAKTLQSVGFEVTKLVDADQRAMKQAMLDFGRKLHGGVDASLFYYSGHGVQAKGENYLIPVDASIKDEDELDLQAIDVNAFLQVMDNAESKVNIVILDACRNNPFASSLRSASRGLAMVDAPRGTYIAYSTAPGDVAEDGSGGNSPYTEALAKAIVKPGVKLEDAFKDARRLVLAATDNKQVPWETTSITGDFYFRSVPSAPPPSPPPSAGAAALAALPSPGSEQLDGDTADKLAQECDTLAANPVDPNRLPTSTGVSLGVLTSHSGTAITACKAAVEVRHDGRTIYELGRSYEAGGFFDLARQWFEKAAALGYAPAIHNLAGMLQKGEGEPADFARARQSYQKAAGLGYAPAMHNLGSMLEKGEGGPVDIAGARQWYEKAADLGNIPAMNNLGTMLRKDRNYSAALQWYHRAADLVSVHKRLFYFVES